jgi:hypothetical protein
MSIDAEVIERTSGTILAMTPDKWLGAGFRLRAGVDLQ